MTINQLLQNYAKSRFAVTEDWKSRIIGLKNRLHNLEFMSIDEITQNDITLWISELLNSGMSPKTIHHKHGILSSALKSAVQSQLILQNPCQFTQLPRIVHHDFKVLSIEQYREYVRQADPEYRLFLRTAFYTGARFGELTALTKQDIDENRNEIRINKCWSDHGQILRDGKTKHARRSIPIHKSLCEDLLEYVKYKNRDDLIFSYENRKYSSARCHNQIIKKPKAFILRKYNINFRFHDIRHTYASWLLNSSIPIFSVSRWMGHASAAFTMDIYGHMIPENRHDIDTLFDKLTVE